MSTEIFWGLQPQTPFSFPQILLNICPQHFTSACELHMTCPYYCLICHVTEWCNNRNLSKMSHIGLAWDAHQRFTETMVLETLVKLGTQSQSPFLRPMAYKAAPISVSTALGHTSANAVKATVGGWSTGSSASLTFPLHSHTSSARRGGSEYHVPGSMLLLVQKWPHSYEN